MAIWCLSLPIVWSRVRISEQHAPCASRDITNVGHTVAMPQMSRHQFAAAVSFFCFKCPWPVASLTIVGAVSLALAFTPPIAQRAHSRDIWPARVDAALISRTVRTGRQPSWALFRTDSRQTVCLSSVRLWAMAHRLCRKVHGCIRSHSHLCQLIGTARHSSR